MKKLVYVTIALVALFAANSCKNKNNVPVISTTDSDHHRSGYDRPALRHLQDFCK